MNVSVLTIVAPGRVLGVEDNNIIIEVPTATAPLFNLNAIEAITDRMTEEQVDRFIEEMTDHVCLEALRRSITIKRGAPQSPKGWDKVIA